jgi:hypothetical protein
MRIGVAEIHIASDDECVDIPVLAAHGGCK